MRGHAVMGEQGVQKGAEHTPLWGLSVEDQRSGDVSYLHHLVADCQEVQDPIAQGRVETQGFQLGGYCGVDFSSAVNEQHSYMGIPLVQMG